MSGSGMKVRFGTLQRLADSLTLILVCELLAEPDELLALLLTSRPMAVFATRYAMNISYPFDRLLGPGQGHEVPPQCRRHLLVATADNFAPAAEELLPGLGITPATVVIYNTTTSTYDSDGRVETFRFDRHSIGFHLLPPGGLHALRRLHVHHFKWVLELIGEAAASNPTTGLALLSELVLFSCDTSIASLSRYCNSAVAALRVVVYGSLGSFELGGRDKLAGAAVEAGRCTTLVVDQVSAADLQILLESPSSRIARLRVLQLTLRGPSDWEQLRAPLLKEMELNVATRCSKDVSLDLNFSRCPSLVFCFVSGCPSITNIVGGPGCGLNALHLVGCAVHYRGRVILPQCRVVLERCVACSPLVEFACLSALQRGNSGRPFTISTFPL